MYANIHIYYMSDPINTIISAGKEQFSPLLIQTDWLKGLCWFLHNDLCVMLSFYVSCLYILATDVPYKSDCRYNRVYMKSCNIKHKKRHVSFVFLHMKSVKTRTVINLS